MGREVRMVPQGWEHPRDSSGRYRPLHEGGNLAALQKEWDEDKAQWLQGKQRDWSSDGYKDKGPAYADMSFDEWDGPRPSAADYMPEWEESELTHLMMYENTSEGSPISPAFETPEELARWLADNGASAFAGMTATHDEWLSVARSGYAPSACISGGRLMSGVEAIGGNKDGL